MCSWRKQLPYVFYGMAMGAADIVPGVSGGTMAFILGIYEELIHSLKTLARPAFWNRVLRLQWRETMVHRHVCFLLSLSAGILSAIALLARGLEWMLEHYPQWVWGFFFGLVAASIPMVSRRVGQWTWARMLAFAITALLAFILVGLLPARTPQTPLWFVLSGMMASVAMILPGVSGSFILVLLGKYTDLLQAVNAVDLSVLALFFIGVVIGLISMAQILGWLFARFHDFAVALLSGFLLGSLRKLWPFDMEPLRLGNVHAAHLVTLLLMMLGAFLVWQLNSWAEQRGQTREH